MILIMPSNREQFNLDCDGLMIGIKGLSTNMPNYFDLEDLKDIDKEIFVSLNKNMFNKDIPYLKEVLLKLNDYNIKGVIYYDISLVNLSRKLDLNYDLVWNQEHMTTNYDTTNFWYNNGIKYTYVSSDITLREMKEIKENTKSKLLVNVFGYIPMFNSKRKLITNYLKTFNLDNKSKINYLEKEGHTYPIVEDKETLVYTDFILNGLKESILLDYDYFVLNSFNIEDEKFNKVLSLFNNVNESNLEEYENELNKLFKNLGKGFFYEETVYKVK